MSNKSALKKNFFRLIILTIGAAAIYGLPYFRYTYWDTFMSVYNLTDKQMANLQTAYGIFALISYLPGGWLADRISVKKLLLFSLFTTAISGYYLLTIPSYTVVLAIHGFWGISTILTFWPAFIKAVRSLANDEEQGKAFGIMEGSRGVINILISMSSLAIFNLFLINSNLDAISKIIIFYASLLVVVGVLIMVLIKDVKPVHTDLQDKKMDKKEKTKIIITELKKPAIWIISGVVFCSYFMNIVFYNFTPYAQNVLKVGPVFAGFMVVLAQWVRPISAVSAGVLGDKFSISKTVQLGFSMMAIGVFVIILLPVSAPIIFFMMALAIIYIAMYALQANHFALLEEGSINKEATGMAVGVISTLGYFPEVIGSQVALWFLVRYGVDNGGTLLGSYKMLFFFLIGLFIVGFLLTVLWRRIVYKKPTV